MRFVFTYIVALALASAVVSITSLMANGQIKPGDRGPRFGDPCGTTLPSSRLPPLLESARLDLLKDQVFAPAWTQLMAARNQLSSLENDGAEREGALISRMEAERESDRVMRSKELAGILGSLADVCSEVIELRVALTSDPNTRVHEIALIKEETARLQAGAKTYSYDAETKRLLSEGKDPQLALARLKRELATATSQRDRLKSLVPRQ